MYLSNNCMERKDIIKTNWLNSIRNYLKTHLSIMAFLLALVLAVTNYLIYPAFLNRRFDLLEVAVVNNQIKPNTKITKEDIDYITFPIKALPTNIYINQDEIIDKFTTEQMTLVKGSFFYKEMLVDTLTTSKNFNLKLKESEFAFSLSITSESGLMGKLEQGEYIDLFFQASEKSNEDKIIIGKLMEHIRIIDTIRDESKQFEQLILAVKEDDIDYLLAAKSIGTIIPYVNWRINENNPVKGNVYDIQATKQLIQTRIYNLRYFENTEANFKS